MTRPLGGRALAAYALLALAACGGGGAARDDGYNAFLEAVASACKPLIIGDDNMGQAIVFNGLGATQEHYNSFLGQTSALYHHTITPDVYRASLTSFVGSGTYNARSFDCIVAHLPVQPPAIRLEPAMK
jgi:hypothetical protein